jgi:hypothetical protein
MAKKAKAVRGKFTDEKYLGPEPDLRGDVTNAQIISAYSWYNYFYDAEQAKSWVIEYLKEFHKSEKELIKNVTRTNSNHISTTCGWNCRILLLGGSLPDEIIGRNLAKIRSCDDGERRFESNDSQPEGRNRPDKRNGSLSESGQHDSGKEVTQEKRVVSIQERVANRAGELIADIEVLLDAYYRDGETFKASDWLSQNDVKPAIAQRIADYYKPLYSEAYDAFLGKDVQLREGYSHYKKTKLKAYVEFLKSIVSAAETRATVMKTVRKPRKKKEKPVSVIVGKLKYKEKDDEYAIVSVDPKQVVGSNQLWVFNTKYRTLAVYNAMGPAGLGVKGSTLTGFDEKTSIVKKLRKPKDQLKTLNEGGKVVLRKFMDGIKCKPKVATGRINTETVLVRIIR